MHAKKSFGQHFLKDHKVVAKIMAATDISPHDVMVEIGPGQGALTESLYSGVGRRASGVERLILIEADRDLIPELATRFPHAKLIQADAAQVDYDKLVEPNRDWILVSNLPYNSANAILRQVLASHHPPKRIVVMLQREVGERLLAEPGEMSLLSVAVQVYAKVTRVCKVKPGAFSPAPKVESMVVMLEPRLGPVSDPERVVALAKIGFSKKRKQLHKNLAEVAGGREVKILLAELGLAPDIRAEDLSAEDWVELASKISA